MLDQNVLHSVETKIEGMGEVRIRVGETITWDYVGLMVEIQWKDKNNRWVHGRCAPEFPVAALGAIAETAMDMVKKGPVPELA